MKKKYTGSVYRKARRLGFSILENNKEFSKGKKRETIPGQHGHGRQKQLSSYGKQLYEKQKLRYVYGLSETQLKNTYIKARKKSGIAGHNLFFMLESRLDNLVYRMNFASTRKQARQYVNHGLILVNGKKLDIPSCIIKPRAKISLSSKLRKNVYVNENIKTKAGTLDFVSVNKKDPYDGIYTKYPTRDQLNSGINEGLIVEFYNRSI